MTSSAIDKLSAKQQRFCREFVLDLNGAQAAIRAGYSTKGAKQQASRLLTDANVCAAVAELQAGIADRLDITADLIVSELWQNHCLARIAKQLPVSNRALDLIAELSGYKLDRKVVIKKSIMDWSGAELDEAEAELKALLAKPASGIAV